jgi:hypothetical protein
VLLQELILLIDHLLLPLQQLLLNLDLLILELELPLLLHHSVLQLLKGVDLTLACSL